MPIIRQAELHFKKADCSLNWGMPEKPDVEALLLMLAKYDEWKVERER